MRVLAAIAGLVALAIAGGAVLVAKSEPPVVFSEAERAAILAHGPWPQPLTPDPSNRLSGNPAAIAFGKRLFSDTRLSGDGRRSCATCHDPARFFSDGRDRSVGRAPRRPQRHCARQPAAQPLVRLGRAADSCGRRASARSSTRRARGKRTARARAAGSRRSNRGDL